MKRIPALILALIMSLPISANAADLLVAQAANFMPAMQEIIPAFKKSTGLEVQATYTSTGKLYAQIINGAPFDLFLAADERRPDKLFAEGLAEKPFIYAKGKVVFWSLSKQIAGKSWQEAIKSKNLHKISIANIETAPYGTAAMLALKKEKLWETVKPELVFAQSIAQAFQFASTGAADAGFCAYSSMFTKTGKSGSFSVVKEAPPVIQAACILKSTKRKNTAEKFVEFLSSPEAISIKKKYGYD
ncbi:molybdate ABC transporter substrate-binding protein [Maridesulfovibrio hydrothermalis]|uniref:Molybdenum ABC transporter, periplasmic molybdate-binding protein n=1 Tax=Maridesulfovibrio hydrothermalis AM13 = DSM 14728 TaxID=1121451 RepID=L0R945_9BACT|nr:molybdate ABC transporter substrate-binding protein [Maridesulfovibrio hydrothermalis]CCO22710.1 Molybdenum ABC transporter, periplasmic molybdate-binding protein [Maridesulfovibrio hydrothermalis AM13 = DSM 14728]